MSLEVTITSFTGNTPVDIYYCNASSGACQFVASVSTFPYSFNVLSPYDETDFLIKFEDSESCIVGELVYVTPTPTNTITPTQTPSQTTTNTQTPSNTVTQTQTPSNTVTQTQTPSQTPTLTQTPSSTSQIIGHYIARTSYSTSGTSCLEVMKLYQYYTYASGATSVPVVNSIIYESALGGTLSSPHNGQNKFLKMQFGSNFYAVKINLTGGTDAFGLCN